MRTKDELKYMQSLPLDMKVALTQSRLRQWVWEYGEDGVYLSLSGGKDSTVLSHIIDNFFPDNHIPRVHVRTGLEYPEIEKFCETFHDLVILKPKMTFKQVIEKYGYPMISKEVSEKAMYAKNYLARYIEKQKSLQADQQTIPYAFALADFFGIERRKADNPLFQNLKKGIIPDELLEEIFAPDGQAPMKAKCLLGTVPHKENGVITNEISKIYDYSRHKYLVNSPFKVSNLCCDVMKKAPIKKYAHDTDRYPITGQMADESRLREQQWIKHGCNGFDMKSPISNPMSFWTEHDVLEYIVTRHVEICSVYGQVVALDKDGMYYDPQMLLDLGMNLADYKLTTTGCTRTGCVFCGFGAHCKDDRRFLLLKEQEPKLYEYVFRDWDKGGLGYKKVVDWINEHGKLNIKY